MFKFLQLNSVFNIVYCGLIIFRLVNECISYGTSFCSSVYRLNSTQYFKIIGVFFFGGLVKTCSSLSYILFSFSRIILIQEPILKASFDDKFNRLNMRVFILLILVFGCSLNAYKLFQYKLNEVNVPNREFPYEKIEDISCVQFKRFECKLFSVFKIIDRSVNDIAFFVFNVALDVALFKKFKEKINKKKKILSGSHAKEMAKKTDNLTKMIIINSMVNFVSLFLPFVSAVSLIAFAKRLEMFCTWKVSCDLINENFQFFSTLPVVLQFFIFCRRFNANFKASLRQIFPKLFGSSKKTEETQQITAHVND